MQREMINKANEIIKLIDENESALAILESCLSGNGNVYAGKFEYDFKTQNFTSPKMIFCEDWEIRLMIHQKKQRVDELKVQLERL